MNEALNEKYREILISPVRECATYSPKFGHGRGKGLSLNDFQALYGADSFYKWLGLDNPLILSSVGFVNAKYTVVRKRNCNKALFEYWISAKKV